jgi:hypothetical protein
MKGYDKIFYSGDFLTIIIINIPTISLWKASTVIITINWISITCSVITCRGHCARRAY